MQDWIFRMKKFISIFILTLFISILSVNAETVIYNSSSKIYHNINCPHGKRCKSCIKIEKQQAKSKGARPCKTCGG